MAGTLYVVATPLGNLEDCSPRAVETLKRVALIACEDTRRTARLCERFGIETPRISCHRFNERARLDPLLARLESGEELAIVCDSGTPGIADPGALLVRAILDAGCGVVAIPGPSAVATLLSASGLPADRFVFDGFLPQRAGERRRRLRELVGEPRTVVVFESPHRIRGALEDIREVLGERPLVLGRELTKRHETILRGSADDLLTSLGEEVRGEISLAIAGAEATAVAGGAETATDATAGQILGAWQAALSRHDGDRRLALRQVSRDLGIRRAELQRRIAELT